MTLSLTKDTALYKIVEETSDAEANDKREDGDSETQRKGTQNDFDIETNTILQPQNTITNETVSNVSFESISVTEEAMNVTLEETALETNPVSRSHNFVSALLAEGDPDLVKVLLDNSKPENLEVFLQNSNITVEELQDFVNF